ncbi:MAG: hypothetical protein HUK15_03500 [Bacteroidales bacterium]|nr:hypothetical protein [Bacteroidales bacterium]
MSLKTKIPYLLILSGLIFSSCEKENIKPADQEFSIEKEYFPLETGKSLIYKVTNIVIDKPSNYYDTSIFYLLERTDVPFIDHEGDTAYRIERYKSLSQNYIWKISSVCAAKLTHNTAEKVEDNQRFIKIKFPLSLNKSWNGNIKNNLDKQEYEITSLSKTYTYENLVLDSCLQVTHDSSTNLIEKIFDCEIYARETGLVYKEITNINSQEVMVGVPIEQRIHHGSIYIQELIQILN